MKPASFEYHAAASLDDALALKARFGGEAKFLAGGQSLLAMMNFRIAQPAVLIDINPLAALDRIWLAEDGGLHIGALVRHRSVEFSPLVATHAPLLAEAIAQVAHPQIRTRGTLCGNLAHADPASELPAVMLALGARLRLASVDGERWLAADGFFQGVLTTALRDNEMLCEIALPAHAPRDVSCFLEVARRQGDYAMMGVAATLTLDGAGRCENASLALCSAGPRPMEAATAARALIGMRGTPAEVAEAAALVGQDIDPLGGLHASRDFQFHLARHLTFRALTTAWARA
jgi:carbon-monoxide dehydrogenase medium subunit